MKTKPEMQTPETIRLVPIAQTQDELLEARAYWSQPDTQPLSYDYPSHYAVVLAEIVRQTGCRSVFEFGCAAGRNLNALEGLLADVQPPLGQIAGMDINEGSIRQGIKAYGLDLRPGSDAQLASLADDSFNLVYTVSVLDHIPDVKAALRELLRIASGYVVLLEPFLQDGTVGKIQSTVTPGKKTVAATPYSYIHDYRALFKGLGADVLVDMALPTHAGKAGPFYRLFLLRKHGTGLDPIETPAQLMDKLMEVSTMRLLMTIQSQRLKLRRLEQEKPI
jgi:SAM-dependent methyltransferase